MKTPRSWDKGTLRDDGPTYKVGEQMGWSVAVGDFNGDGYADVLAGAPSWAYTGHTNIGYAYVTVDLQGFRSGSGNEVLPAQ